MESVCCIRAMKPLKRFIYYLAVSYIYKSFLILSFFLSVQAHSMLCTELLAPAAQITVQDPSLEGLRSYEVSRLSGLRGDVTQSILINEKLRKKISSMDIVKTYEGKYGTHGAYKAQLADGTDVLIKPHSEGWYSSIPKEVGASIFSEIIGLPLVPVAGFRIDPVTNTPASVHLIQKVGKVRQKWSEIKGFAKMVIGWGPIVGIEERSELFGSEITFLMGVLGYSYHEAQPRHVLNQSLEGRNIKSLIDLGSAFIDSISVFGVEDAPFVMLSEVSMKRIESLELDYFKEKLSPYFLDRVIDALFVNIKLSVKAMRAYETGDPLEIQRVKDLMAEEAIRYVTQKWDWQNSVAPPQMAIDFGI